MYFFFGSTPYGRANGRYWGFNAFDLFSLHVRLGPFEIGGSIGKRVLLFP